METPSKSSENHQDNTFEKGFEIWLGLEKPEQVFLSSWAANLSK